MILTCIDSYLVVWKAQFCDGLSSEPGGGGKKIKMSLARLSRIAPLAPLERFAAGEAMPADSKKRRQFRQKNQTVSDVQAARN